MGILLITCSVTSAKFPTHSANLARTVIPRLITLYKIGISVEEIGGVCVEMDRLRIDFEIQGFAFCFC